VTMSRFADAAMILAFATLGCHSQSLSTAHETFNTDSCILHNHLDGSSSSLHTFKNSAPWLESNSVFVRGHRATATETHEVVFQVKQRNMDVLTKILHEISDPDHLNYGNHMTMEEINDISSNPDSHEEIIHYMKEAGATHLFDANGGQSIGFRGSIALWERIFNTEFYSLESVANNAKSDSHVIDPKKFIRSEKYSLPKSLHAHVAHVSNTIDVPTEFLIPHRISTVKTPKYSRMKELGSGTIIRPYLTPERLNQIYDIDDNTGHPRATQAAFEGWGQLYSPEDLKQFQVEMGVPIMPLNFSDPTYEATVAECLARRDYCAEGNLDYQYLSSVSWSPTLHHYRLETRFTEWITTMTHTAKVPYVITISYGSEEPYFDIDELGLFDEGAIKLGLRGVTIIVASGDDGVAPRTARWDNSKCQYISSFPSSSAYVTSVGGTQVSFYAPYYPNQNAHYLRQSLC
jgi:tripeptidyl-peptidase I